MLSRGRPPKLLFSIYFPIVFDVFFIPAEGGWEAMFNKGWGGREDGVDNCSFSGYPTHNCRNAAMRFTARGLSGSASATSASSVGSTYPYLTLDDEGLIHQIGGPLKRPFKYVLPTIPKVGKQSDMRRQTVQQRPRNSLLAYAGQDPEA